MSAEPNQSPTPEWWAKLAADGPPEWDRYLHTVYYLAGMMWVAGAGDEALTALHKAALHAVDGPAIPRPPR